MNEEAIENVIGHSCTKDRKCKQSKLNRDK